MKTALRWRWAIAALSATLLLVGLAMSHPRAQPATREIAVASTTVAAAPGWVDVQGGTRHLSARADGVVTEVAAVGDQTVAAGTVLLRLDDQELQLEQQANSLDLQRQQQAEHGLAEQSRRAQEEVARLQQLVRIQAEPSEVLRQAQAQLRSLRVTAQAARLDVAASQLRKQALALQRGQRQLLAPSRGRVLRLDVHEGEAVTRGAPVIWFAPDAPMIVRAELDERLFSQVRVGMRAEVEAEGGDGNVFQARLLSIARQVGPVRALPEVRATPADDRVVECVLELGESALLIGQRVIVRIQAAS